MVMKNKAIFGVRKLGGIIRIFQKAAILMEAKSILN
jgi:hypothetical protein